MQELPRIELHGHGRYARRAGAWAAVALAAPLMAQTGAMTTGATAAGVTAMGPLAIVPLDSHNPGSAATVTGALEVTAGKAIIAGSGTVTAGATTAEVLLPHRGTLRVCASTTVKLAADAGVPAGETPGLMMALDHGAVEASFATGRNSDIVMTPDFRILISGPGSADVKVRLGQNGDTCVDNAGAGAPYVLVTSVFDSGDYRVQPGQRVMFQHGSLHDVVDQEKEPCGCPAETHPGTNEFPLAQSAGLAPMAKPKPSPAHAAGEKAQGTEPLVFQSGTHAAEAPAEVAAAQPEPKAVSPTKPAKAKPAAKKKSGFFRRIGRFFRRVFGAES